MNRREHKGNTDDASIEYQDILKRRYDHVLSLISSKRDSWRIAYIYNEKTKEECVKECMDLIISL